MFHSKYLKQFKMNTLINYIRITALALVLTASFSCKKSFLEIEPKGKLIASKTADYDLLLNNLDLVNMGTDGHVLLGDELVGVDPYFTGTAARIQHLFKWEDDVYNIDEDAPETLLPIRNLYTYNMIINEVLNSQDGTEAQKKSLQAEALAGRAWTYFLLINYYGKPYKESTAATDPGFPLITEANINGTDFTRASVKEVYDQIVSDLTTAIPNLTSVSVAHRLRMSKSAAQGMLAKVYIFMGKFSEALPLLNSSISTLSNSTALTAMTGLYDFNVVNPGNPTAQNDQENAFSKTIFNVYTSSGSNVVMLTPAAAALYGSSDLRLSRWYASFTFAGSSTVLLRRITGYSTYFGVRVPDLYLLRAEVKARLDDLGGAKADVEALRVKRMPAADAPVPATIASQKVPLLQFIMDERIREFAVQGYRWFDMRRLSVDPLLSLPANTVHQVYSATGTVSATYTLRSERLTLRIPKKIMAENPRMQDNP